MKKMIAFLSLPVVSLVVSLGLTAACHDDKTSKALAAESAYTGELLNCTRTSPTLAASKDCEREVKARWHVDGGAR